MSHSSLGHIKEFEKKVIGDIVLAEDLARMVLIFWEEHENTLDQQLSLALLYFNGFFSPCPVAGAAPGSKIMV